jgi:Fe-S-cluster containining protein
METLPQTADPLVAAAIEHGLSAAEISLIEQRIAGRMCGECTACCTVKSVPELGKPTQAACTHLCQSQCAIYASRPASCRDYACLWRQGFVEGDERRRPDQLGVILDHEPFAPIPGALRLVVWEVASGAIQSDKVRFVIDKLLKAHKAIKAVAYCAAGQTAHHNFPVNRAAYPGEDLPPAAPIVGYDPVHDVVVYEYRKAA